MQERIAKFKGGIAIIKAGGRSEFDMKERRDRIEDALFAVRAAIEEGYVIGGGCALLYASLESLDSSQCENQDQHIGFKIVQQSC